MTTKRTNRKSKGRRVSHVLLKGKGVAAARRRATGKDSDAINFESLENRQLMSVVNVTDFGAKPNDGQDDRSAVEAAIAASQAGDVIQFPVGTLNFSNSVTLRSGRTYQGVRGTTPIGIENLPRFVTALSRIEGGFRLDAGASNITIQDFDINSPACAINTSSSSNLVIRRNRISAHGDHAVRTAGANGFKLVDNFFDHTTGADRAGELWNLSNFEVSRNILYYVHNGFHICDPKDNGSCSTTSAGS